MKKTLLILAALSLMTGAFAPQAPASPKKGPSNSQTIFKKGPVSSPIPMKKAVVPIKMPITKLNIGKTKFAQGYYYKGKNHHPWRFQCWDDRYGCDCFWDDGCWYYYCEPDDCYYPVSYCPYRTYRWGMMIVQPLVVAPQTTLPQDDVPQTDALPPIPEPVAPQENQ